eukprot:CAMPEP_0174851364 /NCGR_PEP_ID=MMETSP1114-20130205/23155_1 /TAXON_ID=312471 /ORGANISM="Neobodo designis, Strain CCAP 1951/1" /LENGTH=83 /DNA_ID=CAMNT_0016085899 /DNA_START=51 /DNA_END=298 /DNA_ORIENTATION=+
MSSENPTSRADASRQRDGEVGDVGELPETPLSPLQRGLMIALVMWVLIVISGPITGPQAIFGALASRGVYRNQCPVGNSTCQA